MSGDGSADPDEVGRPVPSPGTGSPLPFEDLRAPAPTVAAPPLAARLLAFGGIVVGGLLGGMIGYGTADLMSGRTGWLVAGLLAGALGGAAGVGVVAGLTLRAMNEWQATPHPEADPRNRRAGRARGRGPVDADGFELRPHLRGGTPRAPGPGDD